MEIITGTSAQALDTEVALSKEVYTVELSFRTRRSSKQLLSSADQSRQNRHR